MYYFRYLFISLEKEAEARKELYRLRRNDDDVEEEIKEMLAEKQVLYFSNFANLCVTIVYKSAQRSEDLHSHYSFHSTSPELHISYFISFSFSDN